MVTEKVFIVIKQRSKLWTDQLIYNGGAYTIDDDDDDVQWFNVHLKAD